MKKCTKGTSTLACRCAKCNHVSEENLIAIIKMFNNKNQKVLNDFIAYCEAHPEERFWQALRNWSDYNFVYVSDTNDGTTVAKDTFYWENKND